MVPLIVLIVISFALIGYFFGSVLFGAIIGKLVKTNLRQTGSHNIGGTNVSRTLGKHFGIIVALLDASKAYLSVIVCWIIFRYSINNFIDDHTKIYPVIYIGGMFAVLGHCWPIQYLIKLFKTKFNWEQAKTKSGGKGVACTGGTLFAISPWLGLIAFGIFVVMFFIFRYVSLSSMVCMFLPAFMVFVPHISYLYLFRYSLWYPHDAIIQIWLMCMILYNSLIVIIRHKSNIQRLLKHEEKRFF